MYKRQAVVVTRHSAMPEVLGDAALYVDPEDGTSLQRALAQVVSSATLRASLGGAATQRARACTWEAAARQMIAMFEELAS